MTKKLNNQEFLQVLADDIVNSKRQSPDDKLVLEGLYTKTVKENEVEYKPLSNYDIQGIVTDEPHTRNAFINVLYNRVIRDGFTDILGDIDVFKVFDRGEMPLGERWSKMITDINTTAYYDENASPIPTKKPVMTEVYSDYPIMRIAEFTEYRDLLRRAFTNADNGLQEFTQELIKTSTRALQRDIKRWFALQFQAESILDNPDAEDWIVSPFVDIIIPHDADFNIPVRKRDSDVSPTYDEFKNYTGSDDTNFRLFLLSILGDMTEESRKYNVGTATQGSFLSKLDEGQGLLFLNKDVINYNAWMNDNTFTNSTDIKNYVSKVIPYSPTGFVNGGDLFNYTEGDYNGKYIYTNSERYVEGGLVTEIMAGNPKTITKDNVPYAYIPLAWITHKDTFELKKFLDETLTWTNPKALYTNFFSHLWFATLSNPQTPAVRILLEVPFE